MYTGTHGLAKCIWVQKVRNGQMSILGKIVCVCVYTIAHVCTHVCVRPATMLYMCRGQTATWQEWVLFFHQTGLGTKLRLLQLAASNLPTEPFHWPPKTFHKGQFVGFTTLMKDAINYLLLTLEIQRWEYTEAGAGLRHLGNETRVHTLYKTGAHASLENLVSGLPCCSRLVGSRRLMPKDYLSWKCITSLATEGLRNCLEWSPKGIFPKCLLWWKKNQYYFKAYF